jgi:hypothetical protein
VTEGAPSYAAPSRRVGGSNLPTSLSCHPDRTLSTIEGVVEGPAVSAMLELPEAVSLRDSLKEMMEIADSAAISPKYKSGRGIPAAVLGGIAAASWGFHSSIWSRFMETQSITPPPSEGLIYGMNNHGWVYYLSAAQSAQLDLLVYITIASFVFAAIIGGSSLKKPCQNMLGQPAFFLLFILGSPHCCGQPHFGAGVFSGRLGLSPDERPSAPS